MVYKPTYIGWWFQPLWKIWVRQLGWWHSQYFWENKIHGNHSPPTSYIRQTSLSGDIPWSYQLNKNRPKIGWVSPISHIWGAPGPIIKNPVFFAPSDGDFLRKVTAWWASKCGDFHLRGIPNSWLVFVGESPIKIRMMTGGTPLYGNLHMGS